MTNKMKTEYESATIIDDDDTIEDEEVIVETIKKPKRVRVKSEPLKKYFKEDTNVYEIGVDEAGRGPLFGRVYTAGVILPKDDSFDHYKVKDSKKFNSKSKINEVAEYIKSNAVAWYVSYEDEKTIDDINILQATQKSMHTSILNVRKQLTQQMKELDNNDYKLHLLIDGNYFNPITLLNKKNQKLETIPYICIEGGDNKYTSIAAASVLAKVARDTYIEELFVNNPELVDKYCIDSNKGYGAKKNIDGIKEHGITIWHRRSFGICKNYT